MNSVSEPSHSQIKQELLSPTEDNGTCTEDYEDESLELKYAIIDLYCAIKIRSTEELERITDDDLVTEKLKLLKVSSFNLIEYIRASIEVIMNLKIEDLEAEFNRRNLFEKDSDTESSVIKKTPKNIIYRSMRDALQAMVESQETAREN